MPHVGAKSRAKQAVTAAKKPAAKTGTGVRQKMAQLVNEDATLDSLRDLLNEMLNLQTNAVAVCADCGGEMRVKIRDAKKAMDALVAFIEQGEGRAQQAAMEPLSVTILRPPL